MTRLLASFLALSVLGTVAQADPILGVIPSSPMGQADGDYALTHLTDGAGLTSYTGTATHGNDYTTMWLSDGASIGTIKFDLGGTYALNTLYLWNYNFSIVDRGVQDFNVEVSTDGIHYTSVLGSSTLAEGTGLSALASESYHLGGVAAEYVEINITSNWGGPYTGLSSVLFDGAAVPEPSSLILTGTAGLAGLIAATVRRRRIAA